MRHITRDSHSARGELEVLVDTLLAISLDSKKVHVNMLSGISHIIALVLML
jgi:hypothetical protein